jgi:hypothetical protein
MAPEDSLDKFGKFIVENLRDHAINYAELLLKNHWRAPSLLDLQAQLGNFSADQKETVKATVIATSDRAIHSFLIKLQERANFENEIQIIVNGENVVELSDGIHAEAYSDEGWYAKYSKYGEV